MQISIGMIFCIMEYKPNFYDEKRAVRFFFRFGENTEKKSKKWYNDKVI